MSTQNKTKTPTTTNVKFQQRQKNNMLTTIEFNNIQHFQTNQHQTIHATPGILDFQDHIYSLFYIDDILIPIYNNVVV